MKKIAPEEYERMKSFTKEQLLAALLPYVAKAPGRKPEGAVALTPSEKVRRYRERQKAKATR